MDNGKPLGCPQPAVEKPQSGNITPDDEKRASLGVFSSTRSRILDFLKTVFQNEDEVKLQARLAQSGKLTDDEQGHWADYLIDRRKGYILVKYLDEFPSLDHNWVVRRLVETDQSGAAAIEYGRFQNLDKSTKRLLDRAYLVIAPSLLPR